MHRTLLSPALTTPTRRLATLHEFNLTAKTVLIRFDGDVPVEGGKIADDFRLAAALPTIHYCLVHDARVVLLAHRGRPGGKIDPALSNEVLADYFRTQAGLGVRLVADFTRPKSGPQIALVENLRFDPGEEANDHRFARALAAFGDFFCNDAFAVSHRRHASVVGLPQLLPHCVGFKMLEELVQLNPLIEEPERPYLAVLGGAKASDKSPLIRDLIGRIDGLLLGGLVAMTYLAAQGQPVGRHEIDPEQVKIAQACLRALQDKNIPLVLPVDFVNERRQIKLIGQFAPNDLMLDVGPKTIAFYRQHLARAATIFWNGAMGKYEDPAFAKGTVEVARAIAESGAELRIGSGGDTLAAIHENNLASGFTFLSTGGGATLEFIAGRQLPGLAALMGQNEGDYKGPGPSQA